MKTLREIRHSEIVPGAVDMDASNFLERHAARAIVLDRCGRIALLHVGIRNCHKLPGGGIEDGEDAVWALGRELLEEIGCHAEITGELGKIIEYRDESGLKQTSYCYLARQTGEIGQPDFTAEELSEDYTVVWANDIAEAMDCLQQDLPEDYSAKFIRERDSAFLDAARAMLSTG